MIEYVHSSHIDISIKDSLAILQAAQNENILRMGKIFTHFSGFSEGSFVPTLVESSSLGESKWIVSISPGSVSFPNGQVVSYAQGDLSVPITHFGTQYIVISQDPHRMTQGEYAPRQTPADQTVYEVDKICIKTELGGSTPSLGSNELLICRIAFMITSDPVMTDLRAPYSAYWSIPYSISSEQTPVASISAIQNREYRESSLGASELNTESIARNDDSISSIAFEVENMPEDGIFNGRVEKVRGSSFVWEDQLYDSARGASAPKSLTSYDFAIYSNTYRVSLTDAFQAGLASQWSDPLSLEECTGVPSVSISTVGATAVIKVSKNSVTAAGASCMVWASDTPILGDAPPLWTGPMADAALTYNAGAQLHLLNGTTFIYYKVAVIDKFGNVVAVPIQGTHEVTPTWPRLTKMIVLNVLPDMIDELHSGGSYLYSTDTRLRHGSYDNKSFLAYYNHANTATMITKITFVTQFLKEVTGSVTGYVRARPEGGSPIKLFDINYDVSHTYTWEDGELQVPPQSLLSFEFVGSDARSQGHIILEGYAL